MEKKNIRIPQQKRSIAKKERIVDAAYRVFNRDGFFNSSTDDIAEEAGFSVGSIYSYYTDKQEILIACLNKFGKALTEDICKEISSLADDGDIEDTIHRVIMISIKSHSGQSLLYHNEVNSLKFRDEDVKEYFETIRQTMMDAIARAMATKGYAFQYTAEQSFLLFQMLEGVEDQLAFDERPNINHDMLVQECVRLIDSMLIKTES